MLLGLLRESGRRVILRSVTDPHGQPFRPATPSPAVGGVTGDGEHARPAPGAGYDQMARTSLHRWWRPLVGTLLIAVGWITAMVVVIVLASVVAALAGVPVLFEAGHWFGDPIWDTAVGLLSIASVIPVVFLAAVLAQRRRPGTLSSVVGRVRWGWLIRCVLVAAPVMVVSLLLVVLLATLVEGEQAEQAAVRWPGWPRFAVSAAVLVVVVPLQAAGEEYLARGWFIQAFGAWFRTPWPGILAGGVVFVALHSVSQVWGAADLMLYAVVLGWLAVRTGGLEAGIALHAMGNLMVFLLAAAVGQLGLDGSAGDAPWYLFVSNLVMLPLYAWLVSTLHRATGQARVVPGRDESGR
ncbi:Membrane protease YdiL, CAAX protease family [Streptoalloteichus tenebrarius]|uniref:Membrane protease YdiL, CAAX protease family n=1 Tax=Streptoalloteichus tenebrarius (strain ATCC 17920 / DSM 40477 / JCM 4838 / CBS 697.72 / NBRC 16177 / NCIMB 11028 / NRRL B-12390 / A12253. 1 / ISP 5477) TaxID=1933 RepID=A0ABT1HP50_STRSD|nr:Membrane protease YdiL, CAAX protease family [Streptoalloteichus tenebrarius]